MGKGRRARKAKHKAPKTPVKTQPTRKSPPVGKVLIAAAGIALLIAIVLIVRSTDMYKRSFAPIAYWAEQIRLRSNEASSYADQLTACRRKFNSFLSEREPWLETKISQGMSADEAGTEFRTTGESLKQTCE